MLFAAALFHAEGVFAAPVLMMKTPAPTNPGFVSLAPVRAGLPSAPRPVAMLRAPSGRFLPLRPDQAKPVAVALAPASAPKPLTSFAVRPEADDADDAEDSDGEGSAMKLFRVNEGEVSGKVFHDVVGKLNQPVKQAWPLPASAEQHFASSFGLRRDPFKGTAEFHEGVDIAAAAGTPVLASADGTVEAATRGRGFGNYIIVRHRDGSESLYGHMRKEVVREGQDVHQGQKIGEVGSTGRSTGPHLHYQLVKSGKPVNPMLALRAPLATGIRVASR